MDVVRPRVSQRCVPKSGAGSDGRFSGGAQGGGFFGGAPGAKAALRDVHDGCESCSSGLWLLSDRLLLACSFWLGISSCLWEAVSDMTTGGDRLLEFAGRRLHCYCKTLERCHADELIRQTHFGPMGHVSVPFRHAPGGAFVFQKYRDAVTIRKEGVLRSLVNFGNLTSSLSIKSPIFKQSRLFLTAVDHLRW